MCDCTVILNGCVAKQHRMVVSKMDLIVKKKKAEKVKPKIRWWKLNNTSCQEAFRQEVTRIFGGKDGLSDYWNKIAEMLRKISETVLGVTFGKRKGDRETWWWNEEVQESIRDVRMTIFMLDWKIKKVKRSCTDWLGRETEQENMYGT